MLLSSDSLRGTSEAGVRSKKTEAMRKGATLGDSTSEDGLDDIDDADGAREGPGASNHAWEALRNALDARLELLRTELRLEPSTFAADSASWQAGGLTGSIEGYESPSAPWAVRYANEGTGPNDRACSAGVNVWLTARLPVPHLTVYVGVRGDRATFMADYVPRFDLSSQPDHVHTFFAGEQAEHWSELQKDERLRAFRSMDPNVRSLQGPNALALSGDATDTDVVELLVGELRRHVDVWLGWVQNTPLLDESAALVIDARDRALRIALRDHERTAGERFMGVDVAASLSSSMAGPLPKAVRPTEPLAWRPSASATANVDELTREVQRFCAAAQREVAGLTEAGELMFAQGDGRLKIDVTVHRDLGSFMASKPSLTLPSHGHVIIGVHAFLEPEWSRFERPLANAPGGVYRYVHEQPATRTPCNAVASAAELLLPTLCLKLKRREAIMAALDGMPFDEAAADSPADSQAAMRVNRLACRWAAARGSEAQGACTLQLELGDDRELFDRPDGPFGNKGGLYIESRISLELVANSSSVRLTSPTITTPLSGVPEPFLAGHYMKVLCPFNKRLSEATVRSLDGALRLC